MILKRSFAFSSAAKGTTLQLPCGEQFRIDPSIVSLRLAPQSGFALDQRVGSHSTRVWVRTGGILIVDSVL